MDAPTTAPPHRPEYPPDTALCPQPQQQSTTADAEALAAIACGDLRLFDGLVDRYKNRLFLYIRQRMSGGARGAGGAGGFGAGDFHHAQDITQEVFLRLFRASALRGGGSGYRGQASVATWLFTIANNCVTDHLRAQARRIAIAPGPVDDSVADSMIPDPFAVAAQAESTGRVLALLARLPEPQQQVLALKFLGGLRSTEIAEVLGLPVGTVRSRLAYGLNKVRETLELRREV